MDPFMAKKKKAKKSNKKRIINMASIEEKASIISADYYNTVSSLE
jgi:hypothetical protein